jgi:hypothetical protein
MKRIWHQHLTLGLGKVLSKNLGSSEPRNGNRLPQTRHLQNARSKAISNEKEKGHTTPLDHAPIAEPASTRRNSKYGFGQKLKRLLPVGEHLIADLFQQSIHKKTISLQLFLEGDQILLPTLLPTCH